MNKNILLTLIIILIAVGGYLLFKNRPANIQNNNQVNQNQNQNQNNNKSTITNFEECAAAGNPVAESYPRQCKTLDGKNFVENIGNTNELNNLIIVDQPKPNSHLTSPATITGQARGTWYFEARFPIKIVDANGNELGKGIAKAAQDWMTENFVPFTATIEFMHSPTANGNLILQKDNPSGLPENDKQLIIPIGF